ncbi:YcxB family protein [Paenibacillus glacialis]|uniref:YcxB-like C-terminal domain-containing protein n=1 Tax=Paenibacillus glacialis TaxID=494026 RepID=A0A168LHM9_9BACL|nr:YcxB family protein [Paenibacillus glacialis]OAB43405.1 hypothetical protein PGLA_09185 [Paenibacillus glacialis]
MEKELILRVKLKLENILEYNLAFTKRRRVYMTTLLFVGLFILLYFKEIESSVIPKFIICLLMSTLLWLIFKFSLRNQSKKTFLSNELMQQEYTYTISNNGIHTTSEGSTGEVKWEYVKKVFETRNLIIVFISSNTALIFPKNLIGSEREKFTLKYLISLNVDSKKVKFKSL